MENKSSDGSEAFWRGKLSAAARAALRPQPELELEAQLTAALARIPAAPVSSNFTARVLDAVERAEKKSARPQNGVLNWRSLFPRVAVAAAVLIFAGVSIRRHEAGAQRLEIVRRVAMMADAKSLPSVDALENLDVIQRMSQPAPADVQLLADLQ